MPQSKSRKPHKHHIDYVPHEKKRSSIVPVATGVCALLAFGTAWFAEQSLVGLIIGTLLGGVVGYFGGRQMDKTFNKN